jgi:fumarate hydratase, class II
MDETASELAALQDLLDHSLQTAGPHLRSIVQPGARTLTATQVVTYLRGVKHIVVGTATEHGEPRVAPVEGVFWHARLHFTSAGSAVRTRHLRGRPAVSAAHVVGDDVGIWVHGRGVVIDASHPEWDAYEERWRVVYDGGCASEWAPDGVYVRIEPERMYAYAFRPETFPSSPEEAVDGFRVEHDTMGDVLVPVAALYGAQTQRAVENFPISGERVDAQIVHAVGRIKQAAARTNARLGVLPPPVAAAVEAAAGEVAGGLHDDQFPVDVFQTGSGTSTNMNVNEVLAALAGRVLGRTVHPNDEVNASQSSNDVFPSALHVAAATLVTADLLPALAHLAATLDAKSVELATVVKAGRTHLMDAVPVTLGQEFAGYAAQVRRGAERVESSLGRVCEIPLGGTAVGTGLGAPPGWRVAVVAELADLTQLPLVPAADGFEAQSARDALVELSGQLRTVAVSLTKVCNDLRWMGSGPRAGLAELHLPDLQPGSSIMPGKVNPVVPEAVLQVCAQVVGNDATVAWAGAAGAFELNVMLPVIGRDLVDSLRLLPAAARLLADRCVAGLTTDPVRLRRVAESSPVIVTALNRYLGYEEAAAVAKQALTEGRTIREVVVARGHVAEGRVTETQLDEALDVARMADPGRDDQYQ